MVLSIPPLRSRPADIHVLAQHLLDAACARHGRHVRGFAPGVMDVLVRYAWPGNVRELQNEILRMLVLAESDCLGLDLLSPMLMGVGPVTVTPQAPLAAEPTVHDSGTLQERMDALEADVLMETIARCGWNKSLTARELGLSRVGLRAKLERYGIVPDAGKQSLQKGNS
jgi:two-component system response regulator HupR/HoxA